VLEPFGISAVAEAVYLAKLAQPAAAAGPLAGDLGLCASEVDDALSELVEHGLLRSPPQPCADRRDELRPIAPALALDAMLARRRADVLRQQHDIEQARAALALVVADLDARLPAPDASPAPSSAPMVEEIVGPDAARRAVERLAFESQHEVLTFAPSATELTTASLTVSDPLTGYLLSKGVRLRMISVNSVRHNAITVPHLRRLVELGAEVRTAPVLPTAMLIVDRARVVLPLDSDRAPAGASILSSAAVLTVMCALFVQYWQASSQWAEQRPPVLRPDAPSDRERELLDLLLRGNTDEQAGRRLGISTRTVGRMTADIMRRLGAHSRFEAGALAVLRGWYAPPQPEGEPAPVPSWAP